MKFGSFLAVTAFALAGTAFGAKKPTTEQIKFFEEKIRPVLVKNCYQCHSKQTKKPKGGLRVDTLKTIRKGGDTGHGIVPGSLKESLVIAAIKHTGDVSEMPPKQKLSDAVIADFEKWVKMGAPDPRVSDSVGVRKIDMKEGRKFWAFNAPQKTPVPGVKNKSWPKNDIDRYLLAKLESKGLAPVRDAGKAALLRRATYDLTGLPPTPAELEAFLKDSSPNAYEKVLDRLLKSPRFGERWGRHWLDVVRYAESTGKERNYAYPYAWRYRNYVIDSFNADKPYDEFVREQIAGDLLKAENSKARDAQLIATGFLAFGPKSLNERNRLKFTMDVVDDQIDVMGRAFLATTIACARCHDHKFDPIPTKDYYAFAGIFRSTTVKAGVRGRRARGGTTSGLIALGGGTGPKATKAARDAAKLRQLRQQLNRDGRRLLALMRRGGGKKKRKNANIKRQLQRLVARMQVPAVRKNDPPQVKRLKESLTETITQIKKLQKNAPKTQNVAMGVEDGRAIDSKVFIKGEVDDQGELVKRHFLTVTNRGHDPKIPSDASGRLELADWLASKKNPLTARVMANRVWQHLFGKGIVKTVDNFGLTGERPQHPELLDYLAIRFMEQKWSVKSLIKEMMLSRAYGLSSAHVEKNYTVDPANRLVWRGGRRRLDAEAIRDSMLAIAGKLELERPKGSPMTSLGNGEIGRQISLARTRLNQNVRSVYIPVVRQAMPQMMTVFDVADPSLVVGTRDITTVPTQALFMMNSPFVMNQAGNMAQKLFDVKGMDDTARIKYAYRLALSREPNDVELARVKKFITDYRNMQEKDVKRGSDRELEGWTAFCQTLFASAEFRYLY